MRLDPVIIFYSAYRHEIKSRMGRNIDRPRAIQIHA